jgi:hypothetical protein
VGRQCRELDVTLRIADLGEDDARFHDEMGTWLLGHTERITFGTPFVEGGQLLVDATLHVGCRYLTTTNGAAQVTCAAHGFSGALPASAAPARINPKLGQDRFRVMHERQMTTLQLPERPAPARSLPTLEPANPCAGAPCRTADGVQGGACCRDLVLDVVLPDVGEPAEALLHSRQAPFLSRVERESPEIVELEIISACGYLEEDGVGCALHDRLRPDGGAAKPQICYAWPDLDPGETTHHGCRLVDASLWQA